MILTGDEAHESITAYLRAQDRQDALQRFCAAAGLSPATTAVLCLVLVAGLPTRLAHQHLQRSMSLVAVRKRFWRGLKKLRDYSWSEAEWEALNDLLPATQADHDERDDWRMDAQIIPTDWEHAGHLGDALRNRCQCKPQPKEYDESGRPVGGHDPIVDRFEIVRCIQAVRRQGARGEVPSSEGCTQ